MFKHRSTQERRKSSQLTVRLDLHFIATVIDTADGIAVIKQFTDFIAVSDSQVSMYRALSPQIRSQSEELVNDLL